MNIQTNNKSGKYLMTSSHTRVNDVIICSVFVGSWNVNGKSPSEDLSDWLMTNPDLPDLYFIG